MDRSFIIDLPKVNLHCHLGGSMTPALFFQLSKAQGLDTPVDIEQARRMVCADLTQGHDLTSILATIEATYPVLQTASALEETAYQIAENNAALGVSYLELRGAPMLHTRKGLSVGDVIRAVLRGLKRAEADTTIKTGFIVTIVRGSSLEEAGAVSRAALDFVNDGVVALDLAGDETKHPAARYRSIFIEAAREGLGITIHAGEAGGPENIKEAVEKMGAQRIGHGIAAVEDAECIRMLIERQVTLEVCPTSNVYTGRVKSIETHPVLDLMRSGVAVSIGDDDPVTFSSDLVNELDLLCRRGMTFDELFQVQYTGIGSAFCDESLKEQIFTQIKKFQQEKNDG